MNNIITRIIIKIFFAFLLSILVFFCLSKTHTYWPLVNWILKIRGNGEEKYEGEDRGDVVISVVIGTIFPIIFIIALIVVYKLFPKIKRWFNRKIGEI
jgi:hypothetical protein